jgi:hypothetical protein
MLFMKKQTLYSWSILIYDALSNAISPTFVVLVVVVVVPYEGFSTLFLFVNFSMNIIALFP